MGHFKKILAVGLLLALLSGTAGWGKGKDPSIVAHPIFSMSPATITLTIQVPTFVKERTMMLWECVSDDFYTASERPVDRTQQVFVLQGLAPGDYDCYLQVTDQPSAKTYFGIR